MSTLRHEATRAAAFSDKPAGGETTYLTTRQFAQIVGASVIDVVDKHRAGVFVAAIGGRKGRGAKTLYSQDQIEEWKARSAKEDIALGREARRHFTGDEAQKCFRAFIEGRDDADCVAEFGIHPLTVESIRGAWSRSKASLFVSAPVLLKIQALTLDGPLPITSEDDLFTVLEIASRANEPKPCLTCGRGERAVCRRCVGKAATKAGVAATVKDED